MTRRGFLGGRSVKDIIFNCGNTKAHVNAFGAELRSLEVDGFEYLYQGDPAYYGRTSPTLFPIVGRFLNDTYYVGKQYYKMPVNGFAKERNFTVVERSNEHVCFELKQDERTMVMYPFEFTLHVEYALIQKGMNVTFSVQNTGSQSLPYAVGLHTAYRWPLAPELISTDYQLDFEKEEDLTSFNPFNWKCPEFIKGKGKPIKHEYWSNFTRSFTDIKSKWVGLSCPMHPRAVRIHRSEFDYLAVWTMQEEKAEFLCIEPCMSVHAGAATTIEERNGTEVLAPGMTAVKKLFIELL